VTFSAAAAGGAEACVAAYEQLRRHVLAGAAARGGHFGLVLLLREGLAAWIDRRPPCAAAAESVAAREWPVGAPLVADDLHASLVRVLASMALSGRGERRR